MAQIAKNSKVGGIPILDFIYPVGAIFMTMDDDFNVQNALTAIYDLLPVVNANANSEKADKKTLELFEKKRRKSAGKR